MSVHDLLRQLGQSSGVDLQLDQHGLARVRFDDQRDVDIEYVAADQTLWLHTVVAGAGSPRTGEFYRAMLAANLFAHGTAGAVLAIDGDADEVVLQRAVDVEHASAESMAAALEQLVSAADDWSARLSGALPLSTDEGTELANHGRRASDWSMLRA